MVKLQIVALITSTVLFAETVTAQLSNKVPPPSCLHHCILTYGDCSLCTFNGTTEMNSCIRETCDPRGGISYAEVYYDAICSENGYLDYDTLPTPHFVAIPPNNCTVQRKRWTPPSRMRRGRASGI